MNRKILIFIAVLLIVVAAGCFYAYERVVAPKAENGQKEQNSGQSNVPQVQVEVGGIGVQPGEGGASLSVCQDKCGDGICQQTNTDCAKSGDLSCACPETKNDCPEDCK